MIDLNHAAFEEGTEFLLRHHLFKRNRDLSRIAKPWMVKFGFPLMWRTDALEWRMKT